MRVLLTLLPLLCATALAGARTPVATGNPEFRISEFAGTRAAPATAAGAGAGPEAARTRP